MADETERQQGALTRDALRADLSEVEMRLRLFIATELRHIEDRLRGKADRAELEKVKVSIERLERGDFTKATLRAIDDRIEGHTQTGDDRFWTRWGQKAILAGVLLGVCTLALEFIAAIHGGAL